jgi:hypothetical protein
MTYSRHGFARVVPAVGQTEGLQGLNAASGFSRGIQRERDAGLMIGAKSLINQVNLIWTGHGNADRGSLWTLGSRPPFGAVGSDARSWAAIQEQNPEAENAAESRLAIGIS